MPVGILPPIRESEPCTIFQVVCRNAKFVLSKCNDLMAVRENDPLEPIDFGVDVGGADSHTLLVLDVTVAQWDKIRRGELALPDGSDFRQRNSLFAVTA